MILTAQQRFVNAGSRPLFFSAEKEEEGILC